MSVSIGILMLLVSQLQVASADLFGPIQDGDSARVEQLLAKGADVNQKTYNGFWPLHLAEDPAIVEVLLRHKSDLNVVAIWGTPLQHAASEAARKNEDRKKWNRIVKLLLDAGAEYDITSAIHLDDLDRVRAILNKNPHEAIGPREKMYSPLRVREIASGEMSVYNSPDEELAEAEENRGGQPATPDEIAHFQSAFADRKGHDQRNQSTAIQVLKVIDDTPMPSPPRGPMMV